AAGGVGAGLRNHDHWVDPDAVAALVQRGGATLLTNRHVQIRRGVGALLAIAGVDDFTHGAVRLDEAFAGIAPDVPRLLASHNPDMIEYLPAVLRAAVVFSGHTPHGHGQL